MQIKEFVAAGIAFAAGVFAAGHGLAAGPQGQYAIDPQINVAHSGDIDFTTPLTTPLKQAWSVNLGNAVYSPLIGDGMAFAATDGELFAIDLATGAIVWQKSVETDFNYITYDHDRVFTVTFAGQLQAFVGDSGNLKWSIQLPGNTQFVSGPMAKDGIVFVSGGSQTGGGTLYAVSENTGAILWTQRVEDGYGSQPAYGDGGVYVAYGFQFYKFAPSTGQVHWHYSVCNCSTYSGSTPVYFDRKVYVAGANGPLVLDSETGNPVGTFTSSASANELPVFFETPAKRKVLLTFYYNGNSTLLTASHLKSDSQIWSFAGQGAFSAAPLVVNGQVVIASGAYLYVLNGETGAQLWSGIIPNVGDPGGMAAGEGTIVVPVGSTLTAFVPSN